MKKTLPLLLWIIPQLDKFPRLRRYTLGERIQTLPGNLPDALLVERFDIRLNAA